jgi:hypothetical protein
LKGRLEGAEEVRQIQGRRYAEAQAAGPRQSVRPVQQHQDPFINDIAFLLPDEPSRTQARANAMDVIRQRYANWAALEADKATRAQPQAEPEFEKTIQARPLSDTQYVKFILAQDRADPIQTVEPYTRFVIPVSKDCVDSFFDGSEISAHLGEVVVNRLQQNVSLLDTEITIRRSMDSVDDRTQRAIFGAMEKDELNLMCVQEGKFFTDEALYALLQRLQQDLLYCESESDLRIRLNNMWGTVEGFTRAYCEKYPDFRLNSSDVRLSNDSAVFVSRAV